MPERISFEERAERKKLIDQLRAEAAEHNIEGYLQYAEDMEALNTLMDEYSEFDIYGLPKNLTGEMKEKLIKAVGKVAKSGEVYLDNVKKAAAKDKNIDPDMGVPGMVGALQDLISKDLESINSYDPEGKQTSLPELLEKSRTRTVDADQTRLKKLGDSMSSRLAMKVVNSKNEVYPGVYTIRKKLAFTDRYKAAIKNAKTNCRTQAEKDTLDAILPKYRELLVKSKPQLAKEPDEYFADSLVRYVCGEKDPMVCGGDFNYNTFKKVMNAIGLGSNTVRLSVMNDLAAEFKALNDGTDHVNITFAGLNDGDCIDAANSAMSATAALLGRSNLIAKSFAMDLRDEKGQITKGTFMEYSPGLTLNEKTKDDYKGLCNEPFSAPNSQLLKQLADIQVIDYLCGNVDRHFGNLTYLTNDKGQIIGVQGIDNDCSFGRIAGLEKRHKELPGLANMNCISRSMAEKIKSLDPAMVKFSLRGRNLTEEQMDYAVRRVLDLKTAIQRGEEHYKGRGPASGEKKPFDKGYLRIVEDEEFPLLSIDKMYSHGKTDQYNLFSEVHGYVTRGIKLARSSGLNYDPGYKKDGLSTGVAAASDTKYSASPLTGTLTGASNLVGVKVRGGKEKFKVDDLTKGDRTSKQFDEMVKASKYVYRLQKHLQKLEESGTPLTAADYKHYIQLLDRSVTGLSEKTDAYLQNKMSQRGAGSLKDLRGKNSYEQDRIDYAKKASAFADEARKDIASKFTVPTSIEMTEVEKADYRAMKEQQEIDDRRAAMKALEELHRNRHMRTPQEMKQEQAEKRQQVKPEEAVQINLHP